MQRSLAKNDFRWMTVARARKVINHVEQMKVIAVFMKDYEHNYALLGLARCWAQLSLLVHGDTFEQDVALWKEQ